MRHSEKLRTAAPKPRKSGTKRGTRAVIPAPASPDPDRALVIGIGASAGGLDALKAFFGAMPPKTGLVFVVVVHLDPTHESLMPELLSRVTGLTVAHARDRQPLETDHVYVIPPNRTLTIDRGHLRVREVADPRSLRGSIDHFLRSLAEAKGDRAVAVVLSGMGTEGTLGARAVKAEGGLVMAQAPDTAAQPGMPASAIATGLVDVVLPPDRMPEALLAYRRNVRAGPPSPAASKTNPLDRVSAILAVLRARTKFDFSGYERGTLQRRIERRMGVQQIGTVPRYLNFLRSHPTEADQLFRDLLIGVISFFRDPPSFDELATSVLAPLVRERGQEAPIRVWVPGCSTGEEAYSIAIVLAEQVAAARSACRVQIFATDVDGNALEVARAGTYPESIALDVTPHRLQRFFTRENHRCTVAKSIRESVVFAKQNLTTDPPFSRLDLVSCGNVLIHLEPEMQERLLSLFHFALNPGGHLFLGSAEGVGPLEKLFTPISKRRRIYRRLGQGVRRAREMPVPGHAAADAGGVSAKVVPPGRATERTAGRGQRELVRLLEAELRATKKEQRRLVDALESSNEDLKAAHEEVLSMNEELQSTNEELETSKEELQSMNEELTTLNAQLQDKVHELTSVNGDLANLLVSTDIATVFLDAELRIKRFTTAASHVLNLRRSDAGRPMSHIASNLLDVDLSQDGRTVLDTLTTLEKEVAATDGRRYMLRALPYRGEDNTAQGVVLTLVDVTTLKHAEREVRGAREQVAEELRRMTRLHELTGQLVDPGDVHAMIENVIRATMDITDAEMGTVQLVNEAGALTIAAQVGFERPFLEFFACVDVQTDSACAAAMAGGRRVIVDDVTTSPIFAGRPSLPVLTAAGVRAVQLTPLFDGRGGFLGIFSTHYRTVHRFDDAELQWLDLLAHHAVDVLERQRADEALSHARQDLETRVADRTRWLALMHDIARSINEASTWDGALHEVLRQLCSTERWQIGFVYLPQPKHPETIAPIVSCYGEERFGVFHEQSMQQTYGPGEQLPGRVYAASAPFWAVDAAALLAAIPKRAAAAAAAGLQAGLALPVAVQGEVIAVLEIFSDRPHPPDEQLTTLLQNVGDQIGRVLERERATARMADLVWREQQNLLHTLHDSLGQTLTGVGMLSTALRQRLTASDPDTARTAAEIARQTQLALDQVRQLAKSLFPVDVDGKSLMAALRDLAAAAESLHKIAVRVEGPPPAILHNGKIATELYRIAQEAVTNSVKHAHAKAITIRMESGRRLLRLSIVDDGIGMSRTAPGDGSGLRIMRYRAASIGASLAIGRTIAGGTAVTCTLPAPTSSGTATT